eukprot:CAMPEP_0178464340 /NCGR_PEP_ID=MMETSP0689_2-20121128/50791_1 /TAXON_ID=160604 /ORGANISM="Amphidinium massartii, Strain CS-259" /LENGTH=64 /DNA_ID=CAMNT_0020091237 /DNA_START=119 /DNA_END=313 /DNA_ORIENTATION=-
MPAHWQKMLSQAPINKNIFVSASSNLFKLLWNFHSETQSARMGHSVIYHLSAMGPAKDSNTGSN